MDNSGIKKTVFLCESRICVIAGMYVYDSGVCHHVLRFFLLCVLSSVFVTLAMLPVSLITVFTKGNTVITNLAGSIYVIASFLSMRCLQGISPLASVPHIIWYKNFEGVQNNPHIGLLLINVIAVFILYLIASLIILEKQEV